VVLPLRSSRTPCNRKGRTSRGNYFFRGKTPNHSFYILLTVHLEVILVNDQLDALFLNVFILCLYMFRATSASQSPTRVCYTRLCINKIWPSWWWALVARNMYRHKINTLRKSASSWSLTRTQPFIVHGAVATRYEEVTAVVHQLEVSLLSVPSYSLRQEHVGSC
jgi:uncharacterized membrane protein YsdA (DUF1294 family)